MIRRDVTRFILADVFLVSREVEQSLADHDTSKCLAWCHDNRSKLRKLKSSMEFNLRIQEFIELVRTDKKIDAVKYVYSLLSEITRNSCYKWILWL